MVFQIEITRTRQGKFIVNYVWTIPQQGPNKNCLRFIRSSKLTREIVNRIERA
jgi:hypothetical protein